MQSDNPKIKGQKKPNLVRNAMFFNQAIKGCAKETIFPKRPRTRSEASQFGDLISTNKTKQNKQPSLLDK
jgi:hypothetical protein